MAQAAPPPTITLSGVSALTTSVLTASHASALHHALPALARLPRHWTLLYSLDQHGISLRTLYARCSAASPRQLLVVKDTATAVFGVFLPDGLHVHRGFYGGGEAFLFRFPPAAAVPQIYPCSTVNSYVALCEADSMSFGAGRSGGVGLYVDGALERGESAWSETFHNDVLSGGDSKAFEIVGLEVWAI